MKRSDFDRMYKRSQHKRYKRVSEDQYKIDWRGKTSKWLWKHAVDLLKWFGWCVWHRRISECRDIEQALCEANKGMVVRIARYVWGKHCANGCNSSRSMQYEDLEQVAIVGLLYSIRGFDPWMGWKFPTYFGRSLIQRMLAAIRKDRPLCCGLLESCASESGSDGKRVPMIVPTDKRTPAQRCETAMDYGLVCDRMLRELTDRERDVLRYRYGLNGTQRLRLREVGELVGVTRERVRQIEAIALRKLRDGFRVAN